MTDTKICTECKKNVPLEMFYSRGISKRNPSKLLLESVCKICKRKRAITWAKENPTKNSKHTKAFRKRNPNYGRLYNIKRLYGLTEDVYNQMLEEQNNECGICHDELKEGKIHIDHCHSTDKVRGILCSQCNPALGSFKDDVNILQAAIDYLLTSKKDT